MLTFHRTKRGGDDFHVINEGQRVGRIYRTTGNRARSSPRPFAEFYGELIAVDLMLKAGTGRDLER